MRVAGTPSQSTTEGTYTRLYPEKLPFCLKKMSSLLKDSNKVTTTGAAQKLLDKDRSCDSSLTCSNTFSPLISGLGVWSEAKAVTRWGLISDICIFHANSSLVLYIYCCEISVFLFPLLVHVFLFSRGKLMHFFMVALHL